MKMKKLLLTIAMMLVLIAVVRLDRKFNWGIFHSQSVATAGSVAL